MKEDKRIKSEIPILTFKNQKDWNKWLDKNHADSPGIWMRIAKKDSGIKTVSQPEALESVLCYGWIDSQRKKYDDQTYIQKYSPRGNRSIWSKINREKAEELINNKKMKSAGLKAIETAKKNGRWDAAYDSYSNAKIPEDFVLELNKNPKAKKFFATLNSQNRYAIYFRIHNAKRIETRERRIKQFIIMLEKNEKFY